MCMSPPPAPSLAGLLPTDAHPSRCTQACRRGYVREAALDAQVEALLDSFRFDAEVIEWIREALTDSHADEPRFREETLARLKAEIDRRQSRIETAWRASRES